MQSQTESRDDKRTDIERQQAPAAAAKNRLRQWFQRRCQNVRAWWDEWAFVGRSLVAPDSADLRSTLCDYCHTALAFIIITVAILAAAAVIVCAMCLFFMLVGTQALAFNALTPPCYNHANGTVACAAGAVVSQINTVCKKNFDTKRAEGAFAEDATLVSECLGETLLAFGFVLSMVEFACLMLVALIVIALYACVLWASEIKERIAVHRGKWRSLRD